MREEVFFEAVHASWTLYHMWPVGRHRKDVLLIFPLLPDRAGPD